MALDGAHQPVAAVDGITLEQLAVTFPPGAVLQIAFQTGENVTASCSSVMPSTAATASCVPVKTRYRALFARSALSRYDAGLTNPLV